mgnify:CR=1 FL=1
MSATNKQRFFSRFVRFVKHDSRGRSGIRAVIILLGRVHVGIGMKLNMKDQKWWWISRYRNPLQIQIHIGPVMVGFCYGRGPR